MIRMGLIAIAMLVCLPSDRLRAADDKKPDAFQAKSVWQGVSDADPRWAKSKEIPVRLRVIERDGEKFAALISFHKPHDLHVARLEGRIKNGQLVAHITKIIKGAWGEDAVEIVWEGKLEGENLLLARTNKKNMTATCKLKLDRNPRAFEADDLDEKPRKPN